MTTDRKIDMLISMLGEESEKEIGVLEVYLEMAAQKILDRMYPYRTSHEGIEVPERYVFIQLNIVVYWYNKRGAEGQIQHIENGIHRNFGAADIPDGMLAEIVPYCQAIR